MSVVDGSMREQSSPLSLLLQAPRYEVIPVEGIEDKVSTLPYGTTVTVTASPGHGIGRTIDVSARLAGRGFRVVPHLAARMIADRGQLERILAHLEAAAIHEAFVVAGDHERLVDGGGLEMRQDPLELAAVRDHPRGQVRDDPEATPSQAGTDVDRPPDAVPRRGGHGDGRPIGECAHLVLDPFHGDDFVARRLQEQGERG